MDASGVTLAETLDALDAVGAAGEPVTASELAAELECPRPAVRERLDALAERGDVETKAFGGERAWWRPADAAGDRDRDRQLERYRTILETVNDGIYVKDETNEFTFVNETYAEMVGYEPDELVGEHASIVVSGEVLEAADELYGDLLAGDRETETMEATLETGGGEPIEAEASFAVIPEDGDGDGHERVAVVRDITERKERERRLEQQNQRLESFGGMLAHELRNPLSIAQIYLQNARDGEASTFEEVDAALDRMEEIIDILLILARGDESVLDPEPVSVREVAAEGWSNVEADSGRLSVETELVVESEPHHLQHVLENLFQNSLEHGDGDVAVRVGPLDGDGAADGECDDGAASRVEGFYVEDDGPGIPDAERDRVFEAGYTTDAAGVGLGLTFIAQIADAYGWEWRLTGGTDGGARFEFANVDVVAAE